MNAPPENPEHSLMAEAADEWRRENVRPTASEATHGGPRRQSMKTALANDYAPLSLEEPAHVREAQEAIGKRGAQMNKFAPLTEAELNAAIATEAGGCRSRSRSRKGCSR